MRLPLQAGDFEIWILEISVVPSSALLNPLRHSLLSLTTTRSQTEELGRHGGGSVSEGSEQPRFQRGSQRLFTAHLSGLRQVS